MPINLVNRVADLSRSGRRPHKTLRRAVRRPDQIIQPTQSSRTSWQSVDFRDNDSDDSVVDVKSCVATLNTSQVREMKKKSPEMVPPNSFTERLGKEEENPPSDNQLAGWEKKLYTNSDPDAPICRVGIYSKDSQCWTELPWGDAFISEKEEDHYELRETRCGEAVEVNEEPIQSPSELLSRRLLFPGVSLCEILDEIETEHISSHGPKNPDSKRPVGRDIHNSPRNSEERKFDRKKWMKLLPWINEHFEDIMGANNSGAIEYLDGGSNKIPTICITANRVKKVKKHFLERKLSSLDTEYEIKVRRGSVRRSTDVAENATPHDFPSESMDESLDQDGDESTSDESEDLEDENNWPANNLKFQQTPSCGASIGTMDSGEATASFGGLIEAKFGNEWKSFGLSCHHLLETRTRGTPVGHGVRNGELSGKKFEICQPAIYHLRERVECLIRHINTHKSVDMINEYEFSLQEKEHRRCDLEKLEKILELKSEYNDPRRLYFGKAMFSSGYGRVVDIYPPKIAQQVSSGASEETGAYGHTMDWQLIGDIPQNRSPSANYVSGGNFSNVHYEEHNPITRTVTSEFFETTNKLFANGLINARPDISSPEPHCRVHGIGAMTGGQDGYLSSVPSIVRFEDFGSASIEWSFAARYTNGLGKPGDSGAWVFNDFGCVIGVILGFNSYRNLTYFTPIEAIFQDIKTTLGASKVRIAEPYVSSVMELSAMSLPWYLPKLTSLRVNRDHSKHLTERDIQNIGSWHHKFQMPTDIPEDDLNFGRHFRIENGFTNESTLSLSSPFQIPQLQQSSQEAQETPGSYDYANTPSVWKDSAVDFPVSQVGRKRKSSESPYSSPTMYTKHPKIRKLDKNDGDLENILES